MPSSAVPDKLPISLTLSLVLLFAGLAGCLAEPEIGDSSGDGGSAEGSDSASTQDPAGTGDGTDSPYPGEFMTETGALSVYIKDAPTDHFSEIWVNITSVEVHLVPGSINGTDDDPGDDEQEEDGNETTDSNGNETTESNGNETTESNGNETTESNGNETTESNGNETTESNGNETTESNGNETTESNGNETTESNGNETSQADDEEGASNAGGGWIVVVNESRSIDLLSFSEPDSKAFLGDAELTAGRYTQIRLHISDAWGIRAEDGEREEIQLANPVARIVRTFQVDPDNTTQIVIDVDLDRSVRSYGPPHAPHGWRMTPVIGKVQVAQGAEDAREDLPDPE